VFSIPLSLQFHNGIVVKVEFKADQIIIIIVIINIIIIIIIIIMMVYALKYKTNVGVR